MKILDISVMQKDNNQLLNFNILQMNKIGFRS